MTYKNVVGRPYKVNQRTILVLTDALQHSATISDACRSAGISRDTFYRHMNNQPLFAEKMRDAQANQFKLMSYLAPFQLGQ